MLSANQGNKQVLILSDEEDFQQINSKADFEKAAKSSSEPVSSLGKRSYQQLQNLEKLEGDDETEITERELKAGIQAKKKAYKKLADNLVKNEKLQDYFLQIDLEKSLLVRGNFFETFTLQNDGRRKIKSTPDGKKYVKFFKQRKR